jgi:hypothetical protein
MKINQNSLLNVVETKDYIVHHVNYLDKVKLLDIKKFDEYEQIIEFFNMKGFRKMILSNKTKENLKNYKVPKEIRYDVLRTLPNRKDSILLDENTLMRYMKTENEIRVMFDKRTNMVHNYTFKLDLINERCLIGTRNNKITDVYEQIRLSESMDVGGVYNYFIENIFNIFMVVVTYLELTPVTLNVIQPNSSFGTKKTCKVKNESTSNVIVVTTTWNVENVNLCVSVKGHWRLQPYGVGRTSYKYIYIQPFNKGLVRRTSQKELVS